MTTQITTLYDWLIQNRGMREGIAIDIDDRVPEITDLPTPQSLWSYAGFTANADHRVEVPNHALMLSVFDFIDHVRVMVAEGDTEGSVYAQIYQKQAKRSAAKVAHDPRYKTSHIKDLAIHGRARRTTAQVFLGHVWEVVYRLDLDEEPSIRFGKPIPPDVPFPEVGVGVGV